MIKQHYLEVLEKDGIVVVPAVIDSTLVAPLRNELVNAIEEDSIQYPDVFDKGMVHNCMVRGKQMAALLDNRVMNAYLASILSPQCILYAYQSSSLPAYQSNYGSRVHVDCPRFVSGYYTNMGAMFPLDDFTEENGGTFFVPGSHKFETIPNEDEFHEKAMRLCCNAGDMVLLNCRVVHAAGKNTTANARHALTLNFCRSFMRQRFDFSRLVPKEIISSFGEDGRRLIGMNVRMPTRLEEFYLPESERLYKPNQG